MMVDTLKPTGNPMDYKTLLVHVDGSAQSAQRTLLASLLAQRCGAHLVGAALTGISRFLYQSLPPERDDPTLALHLDMQREHARAALAAFSAQCETLGLASFEAKLIDDEAGAGISLHARAADLAVVGQAASDARPALAEIPAYTITHAGRPVLVVPAASAHTRIGQQVLVAWDGGREAARALQLALPVLARAERVSIAVFELGSDPQALADAIASDPRPWLARHGIRAELSVHAVEQHLRLSRKNEIGERLLAVAASSEADLLVMGAYGHSRFREAVLGGVTRTVMETMNLPVFMAH